MRMPVPLVGDGMLVPCIDGDERPYVALDTSAPAGALESVLRRVEEFRPSCSSVHRGAGYKSQIASDAYESARRAALRFAGRQSRDDIAIIYRNTTEADVSRLITAVARIAGDHQGPAAYIQDPRTGDYIPERGSAPWHADARSRGSSCSTG